MENFAWIENWLLLNGFVKYSISPAAIGFVYSHENGNSSFVQIWLKEYDTLRISINHDFPGLGESNFLFLPQTISELKSLLRLNGIVIAE